MAQLAPPRAVNATTIKSETASVVFLNSNLMAVLTPLWLTFRLQPRRFTNRSERRRLQAGVRLRLNW
jgi:hypothetical protein